MRSAAVGHQCVDCVQAAASSVPPVRTAAGAVLKGGPPVVTYGLIAVNVAVFLLQIAVPGISERFSLKPTAIALADQYFRLFTSAFLHYGIIHILFNMWALYVLGPPLERHLGRLRFASVYLLSALGGSVVVYLFSDLRAATVGASGAIYGLFGATFVAARKLNLDVRWLVGLVAVNLVITFTVPNISWQGHLGGLITGALVTAVYVYAPRAQRTLVQVGFSVGLLAFFAALIVWRSNAIVELALEMIRSR
jgi:membrane associated rhomboid family serine protease